MTGALVLGATGFVGQHVVRDLVGQGYTVTAASRSGRSVGPEQASVRLDPIADNQLLRMLVRRHDIVINAAGATSGSDAELHDANVALVAALVDVLKDTDTALIHLGSAAEYAPTGEGKPTREDHTEQPLGEYGRSKLAGTSLVRNALAAGDLRGTVLRLFNPVGPGSPGSSLAGAGAARIYAAIRNNDPSLRFGDLSASRDFIDVRDVAHAITLTSNLLVDSSPSSTYQLPAILNIGNGQSIPGYALINLMVNFSGWSGIISTDGNGSSRSALSWQCADIGLSNEIIGKYSSKLLHAAILDLWREQTMAPAGSASF